MLEQLFFSHKIYEVSLLVCWVHQSGYINLGDWLGLKGLKASLPVLAGCGLGHFNSPPQSVSSPKEARLTRQSQGSQKVKAETSRFLKTQALGLTHGHFHHIILVKSSHEVKSSFKEVEKKTTSGW